jgi:uncharacterized protein YprB with RNaseH-like and TPR domain
VIYLDIETLPTGHPPEPTPYVAPELGPWDMRPPGNYRDPNKILAWQEDAFNRHMVAHREAHEKAHTDAVGHWRSGGLDAMRGRVVCCGIALDDGPVDVLVESRMDAEKGQDRDLVAEVEEVLMSHRGPIVTYNGLGFDQPYLMRRALKWGFTDLAKRVRPPKPWESHDCLVAWLAGERDPNRRKGATLDNVAAFLGVDRSANPISGADVLDRYLAGDLEAIVAHNRDDVHVLRQVARRMMAAGMLP